MRIWKNDAAFVDELYLWLLRMGINVLTLALCILTYWYIRIWRSKACHWLLHWMHWMLRRYIALLFWGAADAMPRVELTSWGGVCDKGMNKCDQASLVCRCLASGPNCRKLYGTLVASGFCSSATNGFRFL